MAAYSYIGVLALSSQPKGISFFAMSMQALVTMCAGASLLAALPSMIHQILFPSPRGLLMGMANSALAFFLFSYQVSQWTRTNCLAVRPAAFDHIGSACLPSLEVEAEQWMLMSTAWHIAFCHTQA